MKENAGVLVETGVLAGVLIQTDANCCVSTISAFIHRSAARKVVALLLQSGTHKFREHIALQRVNQVV